MKLFAFSRAIGESIFVKILDGFSSHVCCDLRGFILYVDLLVKLSTNFKLHELYPDIIIITSGGHIITSGGYIITSGGHIIISGGHIITSGGHIIISGGHIIHGTESILEQFDSQVPYYPTRDRFPTQAFQQKSCRTENFCWDGPIEHQM